jgi:hypothetical protein
VAWVVRREPGWVVVVAPDRPEVAFSVPWAVASSATLLATGFWHPVFAVGLPFLAATAVHEAAHAAAARWHHVGVSRVEVGLLEGRVWLVGQPPDRQWVHIVLAGPLAHAAFGVVLLPLGWWAWELVALGGLIALHGLGNLAPRVDGDRWSDGQVLAELWLSRLPPWVRGAWVTALSGALLAGAAWGAWSTEVPWPIVLFMGVGGLAGAVGGVDLWIRGLKRRG